MMAAAAQKQNAKSLSKIAVSQRLASLKPASAVTPHPALLARRQKPLILMARNGHPNPIEVQN